MKPREIKRAERQLSLLYSLFDSENDVLELTRLRKQITGLCLKLYGTEDAPNRKKKETQLYHNHTDAPVKLTLPEIVERLNNGCSQRAIAKEMCISDTWMSRIISKYIIKKAKRNYVLRDDLVTMRSSKYVKQFKGGE